MSILTHGSDLTLAPTITPTVRPAGGTVRAALERLASAGFAAVQLDAALSGIRPRDLDHQARRDLLGLLTRRSMRLAGLDLFIPRRHYLETEHQDRAMHATLAAIELAADLGRVPVSVSLPLEKMPTELTECLVEAADGRGVSVAVHGEGQIDTLLAWLDELDMRVVGAALDAAAAMARGAGADALVHQLAKHLAVARLSDVSAADAQDSANTGVRCPVGEGDLDVPAYRIAVDLCPSRHGPVVLDLRGLANPLAAAVAAAKAWQDAAITL